MMKCYFKQYQLYSVGFPSHWKIISLFVFPNSYVLSTPLLFIWLFAIITLLQLLVPRLRIETVVQGLMRIDFETHSQQVPVIRLIVRFMFKHVTVLKMIVFITFLDVMQCDVSSCFGEKKFDKD